MTAPVRLLRLDESSWDRLAHEGSLGGAALVAMGAYVVLAFDRFGPQGFFAPRATIRFLLAGFYGWLWLAVAAWVLGWILVRSGARFEPVFRVYGFAHLPMLVLAGAIQVISVLFRLPGPALLVAVFGFVLWMPALLVAATRTSLSVGRMKAVAIVAGPYLVWLLVVGRSLVAQLGHLL